MREENKGFMGKFRLMINDLEDKYLKESVKEVKASAKLSLPNIRTTIPLLPLGTHSITGEKCPESGIWTTEDKPIKSISILKGNKMPPVGGKAIMWKLIDYKLTSNIKIRAS
jgi:hypothetical protein